MFCRFRLNILYPRLLLLDINEAPDEADDDEDDQGGHDAGSNNEDLLGE